MAGGDAVEAVGALVLGFGVEGYEFEVGVALMAYEAARVEAFAGCAEDAASDGEGAVRAEGAGLADGRGVVRAGLG